jgi:hypothetical protein
VSLTSIIRDRAEIREGLRARVMRPPLRLEAIKAPPLTANYGIVATAFDYLLRFFLQRLNKAAQASIWVAEQGVEMIGASEFIYDLDSRKLSSKADRKRRKADGYLEEARRAHKAYLENGRMDDALLISVLRLAYLDVALRIDPDRIDWKGLNAPDARDAADLRALLTLVDPAVFRAKRVCLLNPTFGTASMLVGGADADLLVDDCLIDVKNTKDPHLDARDFFQLIGYYLLHGYAGTSCGGAKTVSYPIGSLGIYFSRFGVLWKFPVEEILPRRTLPETARWFFDSVCTSKSARAKCLRAFAGPLAKHLKVKVQTPRKERG